MNLGTYPLVAWGSPDNISAYTKVGGNMTVTGGQADPFGGTGAYLLDHVYVGSGFDTTYMKSAAVPVYGTTVPIEIFMKKGSPDPGYSGVILYDQTSSTQPFIGAVVWDAGGAYGLTSAGTALALLDFGNGWYLFRGLSATIVSGNTHHLQLHATDGGGAVDGATYYYVRNHVLLDVPSAYRRYARARGGYQTAVVPSGSRDSWSYGDEWVRTARQSWVPATARDTPVSVSGFVGQNELTGVNCGVEAMLRAGWDMQSLTWVPDRSACSVNQSVYLTAPGQDWQPQTEGNGDTAFDLELVSASAPGAVP